jgi:hypothetical protein
VSLRCAVLQYSYVFLYEEQQVLRCARIGIYSLIDFAGRLNEILLIMFIVLDVGNWIVIDQHLHITQPLLQMRLIVYSTRYLSAAGVLRHVS